MAQTTQDAAPAPDAPSIAYIVRGGRFGPYPQHTALTAEQVATVLAATPPHGDLTWPDGSHITDLAPLLAGGVLEAVPADAPEVVAQADPATPGPQPDDAPADAPKVAPDARQRKA